MFSRIYVVTVVLLIFYQDVNGAMKKSWKSAANFDAEIPKFTPFNNEGDLSDESNLNEVQLKTTQVPTSPSPSAETLTSKIRSKIKAPSKYVADIYNQIRHGPPTNANTDFGTFDADMSHHESDQPPHQETANDEIDIEQVLNQLNQEADKHDLENDSIENSVDSDDELEVSSGANSTQFKVGPLMNVTIDSGESVVNVNLDQNTLKEIFTGSRSHAILSFLTASMSLTKLFISSQNLFRRSRQEVQHVRASRSVVHPAVPDSISRRPVHGHNDQTVSHEVAVRWQDRRSAASTRRFKKSPKQHLHEVDAALALLPEGLPAVLPRATTRD